MQSYVENARYRMLGPTMPRRTWDHQLDKIYVIHITIWRWNRGQEAKETVHHLRV
jgi:hypothetical protein